MKGYQIIASARGVDILDAVSLETETSFACLYEALAHLEILVEQNGAIDVQIDNRTWRADETLQGQ
ncbi:MAG: hypothetical protein AAF563_03600 [Pseudomonadota bacterium]